MELNAAGEQVIKEHDLAAAIRGDDKSEDKAVPKAEPQPEEKKEPVS